MSSVNISVFFTSLDKSKFLLKGTKIYITLWNDIIATYEFLIRLNDYISNIYANKYTLRNDFNRIY